MFSVNANTSLMLQGWALGAGESVRGGGGSINSHMGN